MPSDATTFSYQPDYVVRPGETLAEVLQTRGMSQAELARRTGLSTKHVNQVINGDASITAETALRLETVTGISARMWTNLESQYRERLTRQHDNIALEADLPWLDEMPVHELKQRGYLSASAHGTVVGTEAWCAECHAWRAEPCAHLRPVRGWDER